MSINKIIQLPGNPKLTIKGCDVYISDSQYYGTFRVFKRKNSKIIVPRLFVLKHSRSFLYVANLDVPIDVQNRGIGTRLLTYLKIQADKQKLPIYLYTVHIYHDGINAYPQNDARKNHFYTKNGFTVVDTQTVDEGDTLLKLWKYN